MNIKYFDAFALIDCQFVGVSFVNTANLINAINYFPIQKRVKMESSKSSTPTSPVMSPK